MPRSTGLARAINPEIAELRKARFDELWDAIKLSTEISRNLFKRTLADWWKIGTAFAEIRKQKLYEYDADYVAHRETLAKSPGTGPFESWVEYRTGWSRRHAQCFEDLAKEYTLEQLEGTSVGLNHLLAIAKTSKYADDPQTAKTTALAAVEGKSLSVKEVTIIAEEVAGIPQPALPPIDVTPVDSDDDDDEPDFIDEVRRVLPPVASDSLMLGLVPTQVDAVYWDPIRSREVRRVNRNEVGAELIGHLHVRADLGDYMIEIKLGEKPCLWFSKK